MEIYLSYCSCWIIFGARGPKVHEIPLLAQMEFKAQWTRKPINKGELLEKYINQGWSLHRLSQHFDRSPITVRILLKTLKEGHGSSFSAKNPTGCN